MRRRQLWRRRASSRFFDDATHRNLAYLGSLREPDERCVLGRFLVQVLRSERRRGIRKEILRWPRLRPELHLPKITPETKHKSAPLGALLCLKFISEHPATIPRTILKRTRLSLSL